MTKDIIIRHEEQKDFHNTELMVMRAFWNIHGPGCNEHYITHILRTSSDYLPELSLIAELDHKIVGAIFYSKCYIMDGNNKHEIVTFGPLAVEPTYANLGIGRHLLKKSIELVKQAGYPGICIYGEPNYYPKFGFVTCDNYQITDPDGNNFSALMAYEVKKDGFKNIKGKLFESEIFEQGNDLKSIEEFNKYFPAYPQYKIPSQWLHEQKLGKIIDIKNNLYFIQFWEKQLTATISDTFVGKLPKINDLVTFKFEKDKSIILTTEKEI